MVDIQSAAAEIRRGKKRRKNKSQHENIMVCPIAQGDHNQVNNILELSGKDSKLWEIYKLISPL